MCIFVFFLQNQVDTQRSQYKQLKNGNSSSMTEHRIARLEKIDFVWNVYDFKWDVRFEELEQFYCSNGHCNVPKKSRSLHRWLQRQKVELAKYINGEKSSITDIRYARLEGIRSFILMR